MGTLVKIHLKSYYKRLKEKIVIFYFSIYICVILLHPHFCGELFTLNQKRRKSLVYLFKNIVFRENNWIFYSISENSEFVYRENMWWATHYLEISSESIIKRKLKLVFLSKKKYQKNIKTKNKFWELFRCCLL